LAEAEREILRLFVNRSRTADVGAGALEHAADIAIEIDHQTTVDDCVLQLKLDVLVAALLGIDLEG
jgi:hypothetical protein